MYRALRLVEVEYGKDAFEYKGEAVSMRACSAARTGWYVYLSKAIAARGRVGAESQPRYFRCVIGWCGGQCRDSGWCADGEEGV